MSWWQPGEGGPQSLDEGRRRSPEEPREVRRRVGEQPRCDVEVELDDEARRPRVEPRVVDKDRAQLVRLDGAIDHLATDDFARGGGKLVEGPCGVPAELVDLALVALAEQDGGRASREVRPCG